ncbi:hypothetical protein D3C87_1367950 [compost metagenome]
MVNDVLMLPALAVIVMRGKNAARAAPMFALADSSACSAWRMSGRCVSRSDGKPSGMSLMMRSSDSCIGAGRLASSPIGLPTSTSSAFCACARWRASCAAATRACATSDSLSRRSRAEVAPASKRRFASSNVLWRASSVLRARSYCSAAARSAR